MYGLSLIQMLFVWGAVTGAMIVGCFLLACIVCGLTPKRPQYFPLPEQPWVWTEVEFDGSEVEYSVDELLEMAVEDGGALLESDKNAGKVHPLPKERAA